MIQKVYGYALDSLVAQFCDTVLAGQTPQEAAHKIEDEAIELCSAPDDAIEAVDVFITVLTYGRTKGLTLRDFIELAEVKMIENLNRTWKKKSDGTYQHTD